MCLKERFSMMSQQNNRNNIQSICHQRFFTYFLKINLFNKTMTIEANYECKYS